MNALGGYFEHDLQFYISYLKEFSIAQTLILYIQYILFIRRLKVPVSLYDEANFEVEEKRSRRL